MHGAARGQSGLWSQADGGDQYTAHHRHPLRSALLERGRLANGRAAHSVKGCTAHFLHVTPLRGIGRAHPIRFNAARVNDSTSTLGKISTAAAGSTALGILAAISFCHLLNDMMQSLLPAIYPMIKSSYRLSFAQIGLLTFTFQFNASLLQPLVGAMADKTPRPYSLAVGMGFTLVGL